MSLQSTHPLYADNIDNWKLMRVCSQGESAVKAAGQTYLPPTPGQELDGMNVGDKGYKAYLAYKLRAVFPDYVNEAVENYVGLLHQKPATITLPAQMEPLVEKATQNGEGLQNLLRRINAEQLLTGRVGMLLDLPVNPDPAQPLPYIALYCAESIRNWDNSDDGEGVNALNLVVLDESGFERDSEFNWVKKERYRVLQMGSAVDENGAPIESAALNYVSALYNVTDGDTYDPTRLKAPELRGVPLEEIPFVIVNSKDIIADPDNPPLLGLGELCMTIYRGEADYRHTLFMQGQDTLVVIGGLMEEPNEGEGGARVGAGARLDVNLQGDAKYIGIGEAGLSELRSSLENDRKAAEGRAGKLIAPGAGKQESGDALFTRISAQTASLKQIAQTGAAGLENILRIAAKWMGLDPDTVKVDPNLDFADVEVTGQDVVHYMTGRTMGAPLSLRSIHNMFVDRGLTSMTFEEELDAIAEEDALLIARGATGTVGLPGGNPAQGNDKGAGGREGGSEGQE